MTVVSEPAYRKRIGYQAGLLGGFSTLAAALLILGYSSTHEPIEQRQAEDLLDSLSQVLPASIHDNKLLDNAIIIDDRQGKPLTIYRAMKEQHITGFAYRTTARGYAGDIELMLGVNPDGELIGVRVLAHAETPGLGDKIEAGKSNWILGFNGRSLGNTSESDWRVKKDGGRFDQFSGATITPRGVVRAVHEGLVFFREHRDELAVMPDSEGSP
jgi:H+/Na+-translocating ferredoxin:NAD+ oxidoreductase subunit G